MAAVPLVAMACAGITEVPTFGEWFRLRSTGRAAGVAGDRAVRRAAVPDPVAGAVAASARHGGDGRLVPARRCGDRRHGRRGRRGSRSSGPHRSWPARCAVTVGLLVTGAFHEDGLGDIADAFGGGYTVERRLEILKDSRHGTYGVAAMCASIVVRVVALGSMPSGATLFASAVAAHVIARGAAVALMAVVPLARHSGLGADYGQATTRTRGIVTFTMAAAFGGIAVGWWAVPALGVSLAAVLAVGALARHKIGGISGDVLGAAEQVSECAVVVLLGALALHHPLWWA